MQIILRSSISLALLLTHVEPFLVTSPLSSIIAGSAAAGSDFDHSAISKSRSPPVLLSLAARRPIGSSAPTTKRNKNGSPAKRKVDNNKSFTTKATAKTATKARSGVVNIKDNNTHEQSEKTRKVQKTPPPWQVLNPKEAKKNVQKEIERRSSTSSDTSTINYTPSTENASTILSKAFLSETESRLLQWKPFSPYSANLSVEFHGAHVHHTLPVSLGVPEICFLGRSNVGKSSLLNALARNHVARVGKTPGATASVNLYSIVNDNNPKKPLLGMVDLPGFGYAKLSKTVQSDIAKLAEDYLNRRQELALGILLVDIRREPQEDDKAVLAALYDVGVPILIVATKLDKIDSEIQRQVQLRMIQDRLGLPDGQPLAVSSVTGENCRLLWRIILEACEDHISTLNQRYVEPEIDLDPEQDPPPPQQRHDDDTIFDDHDDIVYEQGYDWIHGTVMLEDEEGLDEDENFDDDDDTALLGEASLDNDDNQEAENWDRMTIQDWDRKARDMERRGLL